jgi:hypothetical protein
MRGGSYVRGVLERGAGFEDCGGDHVRVGPGDDRGAGDGDERGAGAGAERGAGAGAERGAEGAE